MYQITGKPRASTPRDLPSAGAERGRGDEGCRGSGRLGSGRPLSRGLRLIPNGHTARRLMRTSTHDAAVPPALPALCALHRSIRLCRFDRREGGWGDGLGASAERERRGGGTTVGNAEVGLQLRESVEAAVLLEQKVEDQFQRQQPPLTPLPRALSAAHTHRLGTNGSGRPRRLQPRRQ